MRPPLGPPGGGERLSADLWYGEPATDFAGKDVGFLGVARNRLNFACVGIAPEGMYTALALEIAAVQAQMAKQGSLHSDSFLNRFRRKPAQAVLAPIFQDQANRFTEAGAAFLYGAALSICARNFRGPGNKPATVPFYDRRELIAHG